jgi:hypothetical protein
VHARPVVQIPGLLEIVWMDFQRVAVDCPLAQGFAEFSKPQKRGMNWRWEERDGTTESVEVSHIGNTSMILWIF